MGFAIQLLCCITAVQNGEGSRASSRSQMQLIAATHQQSKSNDTVAATGQQSKSNLTVATTTFNQHLTQSGAGGGGGGGPFDHWHHDGLAGAISKICVRAGARIDKLTVHYAGHAKVEGGNGGGDRGCFPLLVDEFITQIWLRYSSRVNGIQFITTRNRRSLYYGGSGGSWQFHRAPPGNHLMGLFGRDGAEIDKLGFWWGRGGGSGKWEKVHGCHGCGELEWKIQQCSQRSGSSSNQVTNAWSLSVSNEISAGFELGGSKTSVTAGYSREAVSSSSSSFMNSVCVDKTTTCGKTYLWQWTFSSNFDRLGRVDTRGEYACTDDPAPCCMPGTFSTNPGNCDLDRRAPNTCR